MQESALLAMRLLGRASPRLCPSRGGAPAPPGAHPSGGCCAAGARHRDARLVRRASSPFSRMSHIWLRRHRALAGLMTAPHVRARKAIHRTFYLSIFSVGPSVCKERPSLRRVRKKNISLTSRRVRGWRVVERDVLIAPDGPHLRRTRDQGGMECIQSCWPHAQPIRSMRLPREPLPLRRPRSQTHAGHDDRDRWSRMLVRLNA